MKVDAEDTAVGKEMEELFDVLEMEATTTMEEEEEEEGQKKTEEVVEIKEVEEEVTVVGGRDGDGWRYVNALEGFADNGGGVGKCGKE